MNKKLKFILFGNKKLNLCLLAIFAPYFLFYAFPDVYYSHCEEANEIKICSHDKIGNLEAFTYDIRQMLSKSEIYKPEMSFDVYVTKSFLEYRYFCPLFSGSFAMYSPVFKNIYLNKTNLRTGKVARKTDNFERSMLQTIVHEATHQMAHEYMGNLAFLMQDAWLREGYPDTIAGESTYNYEQAAPLIIDGSILDNKSAMYLVYKEAVGYLIYEKGYSFQDLVEYKDGWEPLKERAFAKILNKGQK